MNVFEKLKNGESVDMMSEEYRPAMGNVARRLPLNVLN